MRIATSAVTALAVLQPTLANPAAPGSDTNALLHREPNAIPDAFERAVPLSDFGFERREVDEEADGLNTNDLQKRRGGGGRGGGSSGGSSSGSSGGSSSSGSRGGSTGSGVSNGGTRSSPSYGGGRYYGGGSTSSYAAGGRSPSGILPFAVGGAALGFGFAGAALLWPHPYIYPWSTGYNYRHGNRTNRTNTRVETRQDATVTLPVKCLCAEDQSCGCDDNKNTTYFDEFFGNNGFNDTKNASVATIQNVNGTDTVILNGTLPADDEDDTSAASAMLRVETGGYVAMAAGLAVSLWVL